MAKKGEHKTVQCAICGSKYIQSRRGQIYCSGRCGSIAWRKRSYLYTILACEKCGKKFQRRYSPEKYCSARCRLSAEAKRRKIVGGPGSGWSAGKQFAPRRTCKICKTMFYAPPVQMRRGGGKFCSNDCRVKFMSSHPEYFPQTRTRRGKGGRRPDLGFYLRSSWEANYARYLNWLQQHKEIEKWEYEADTFEFPIKRGTRFYTPDFKIWERGKMYYVEIKGYMDARSATKLKRMKKYYPNITVKLVQAKNMRAIQRSVASMIPNWESGLR